MKSDWIDVDRPGYFGKKRDEILEGYDKKYGKNGWRLVWKIGDIDLDFLGVCAIYEDSYFEFLKKNPEVLKTLITEASNVYDDDPSNVNSGLDYTKQETKRTHIQDIAIRRSLIRLGKWFEGSELIRIRQEKGNHPLSMTLSPGRVPFHSPLLIIDPEIKGWWDSGTVESFYQSNRYLQVLKKDPWKKDKKFETFVYLHKNLDGFITWLGDHNHTGISLIHSDVLADIFENQEDVFRTVIVAEKIDEKKYKVWSIYRDKSDLYGSSIEGPINAKNLQSLWQEIGREDKNYGVVDLPLLDNPIDLRGKQWELSALFD